VGKLAGDVSNIGQGINGIGINFTNYFYCPL